MDEILDKLWKKRHPKDVLFLSIIEGYTIKESKYYPNDIFYIKDDSILINYELKTKYVYINNELIWSVFSSKFSLNYNETSELLRGMLETHLKLEGTTPTPIGGVSMIMLETHLKLEGTTPETNESIITKALETHLKLEGTTPYLSCLFTGSKLETHLKLEGITPII